jgi:hypothetical protein
MTGIGDKVAEVNGKITTQTFDDDGTPSVNIEQEQCGPFGAVASTGTFVSPLNPAQQTGFYFEKGFTLAPDGSPVPFTGQGIWHESASGVWKVQECVLNVEGVRVFAALTFTFANKSVTGALYALD